MDGGTAVHRDRDQRGVQKYFAAQIPPHHLQDQSSDSLYSGNDLIAFSTICDLCPKVRSSIFLSIQSLRSLGTVIVNLTRSFLVRDMSHGCEHKHINMSDTIYANNIQSIIDMINVWSGVVWSKENC